MYVNLIVWFAVSKIVFVCCLIAALIFGFAGTISAILHVAETAEGNESHKIKMTTIKTWVAIGVVCSILSGIAFYAPNYIVAYNVAKQVDKHIEESDSSNFDPQTVLGNVDRIINSTVKMIGNATDKKTVEKDELKSLIIEVLKENK
jgi:heme/copper-type cytochrome/quinol oxidase subunit 2